MDDKIRDWSFAMLIMAVAGIFAYPLLFHSNITGFVIENETISNSNDKSITIGLEYRDGSVFDPDNDGHESTGGAIDFSIDNADFNWDVDKSKLCAKWEIYSIDEGSSELVCHGSSKCCEFIGLSPSKENWDDPYYAVFGSAAGFINTVSAQVLYVDYSLGSEPYSEIYSSNWANLSAAFYLSSINFENVCVDTCLLDINSSNYTLIFEIENSVINLDLFTYTISREVPNVLLSLSILDEDGNPSGSYRVLKGDEVIEGLFVQPGFYDIEIDPKISSIESIIIKDTNVTEPQNSKIGVNEIGKKITIDNLDIQKQYAVDLGKLEFSNAKLTSKAKGNSLYRCSQWDYERQICFGQWERLIGLVEGERYSLEILKGSSAYAEGSINASILNLSGLFLLKDISQINIGRDSIYTLNLSEYFSETEGIIFSHNEVSGLQISYNGTIATIRPSPGFVGSIFTFINADKNGEILTSNVFGVSIKEINYNITPKINLKKQDFGLGEDIEIEFEYLSKDGLVSRNLWKSEYEPFETGIIPKGISNRKEKQKWTSENETIEAFIYDSKGSLKDIGIELEELREGKFSIKAQKPRSFTAGKYTLRLILEKDGQAYISEQNFTWGVLALNLNKSIYLENDDTFISIGVLDDEGKIVCDANVILELTDPLDAKTVLSTSDGSIKISPECEILGVTLMPDYYSEYYTSKLGRYRINLTATTDNGIRNIQDEFNVTESAPFDVARKSATRIYPLSTYAMDISIIAGENFNGEVKDYVPASFEIINPNGAKIETINDTKVLTWDVKLKKGDKIELKYEYDAPDISPEFYLIGPLAIGSWAEHRQWQIANDAVVQAFFENFESGNLNNWINTALWAIATDQAEGTNSAKCTGANDCDMQLATTIDTSGAGQVNLTLRFRDDDLDGAGDVPVYFNDSSNNWDVIGELDDTGVEDQWITFTFSSSDAQYLHRGFNVRFATTLDGGGGAENIWIDNVNISYITETVKPRINSSLNNISSVFLEGNRVNLTANVSDNYALSSCQFIDNQTLDNGAKFFYNKSVTGTSDQCSQNYTIRLAHGSVINFTVIVNDTYNNINQSEQIITVLPPPGSLYVNISLPLNNSNVEVNTTFILSANITCKVYNCGAVSGTARYNDSASHVANKSISTVRGATPLFINTSAITISRYDFVGINYPSPIASHNATYGAITSLPPPLEIAGGSEFGTGTNGLLNNYTNISTLDNIYSRNAQTTDGQYAYYRFIFRISENPSSVSSLNVYWNGTGGQNNVLVGHVFNVNLSIWNGSIWESIGNCTKGNGFDPGTEPGCVINKSITDHVQTYINTSDGNSVKILAFSTVATAGGGVDFSIVRTNYIELNASQSSNTLSCGNLAQDTSCILNWTINASGDIGSQLVVDVNFTSNDSTVRSNDTEDRMIKITGITTTNLNCTNITTPGYMHNLTGNASSYATCINVLANNVTIDCKGYTINYSNTSMGHGINISSSNGTSIRSCKIVQAASTSGTPAAILGFDSSNATIHNNTIDTYYSNGYGIYLIANVSNSAIFNVEINTYAATGKPMYISQNSNYNIINNSKFTSFGSSGDGITQTDSDFNRIINNNISALTGGNGINLALDSDNNTILNNKIIAVGTIASGISLQSGSGNNSIHYNNITTNGSFGDGIALSSTPFLYIANNTILTTGLQSPGISLTDSLNTTISNNSVTTYGTSSSGITMGTSSNNSISGNIITTNGTGAAGISIASSSNNNTFEGNIISTNGSLSNGVRIVTRSISNLLSRNNITVKNLNGAFAVSITGSSNYTRTSNNILFSTSAAIMINNSGTNVGDIGETYFINDTIIPCSSGCVSNNDIVLTSNASNIYFINLSMNKSRIAIIPRTPDNPVERNNLTVQWYLDVAAKDFDTNNPIQGAQVDVNNSFAGNVFSGTTSSQGTIQTLTVTEFEQNGSVNWGQNDSCREVGPNINITCYTPYNISVNRTGYNSKDTSVIINRSKSLEIVVESLRQFPGCANISIKGFIHNLTGNASSTATCINVLANNVTIDCHGYQINYSNTSQGYGINVTGVNHTTVRSCDLVQGSTQTVSDGIYVYNTTFTKILNNTMVTSGFASNGIHLLNNATYSNITKNTIITSGSFGYGALLDPDSNNNLFYNNTITASGLDGYGIQIFFSFNNSIYENTIVSSGENGHLIYLYRSPNNSIYSNTLTTSGLSAHTINSYTSSGNTLYNNNISVLGSNGYGTYLDFSSNNTVYSNIIVASGASNLGVFLSVGSSNNSIYGNTITTTKNSGYGIYLSINSNNQIYRNTITTFGSSGHSTYLSSSSNNLISSNLIRTSNSSAYGLLLLESKYNRIFGNNITVTNSSGSYAITVIEQSNHTQSYNNTFYSASSAIMLNNSGQDMGQLANITFTNDTIIPCLTDCASNYADVIITSNVTDVTFLNVSFNKSRVQIIPRDSSTPVEKNNFTVKWYLDVNVVDSLSSNPIAGAQVVINDSFTRNIFNGTTSSSGSIQTQIVTEFEQNGSVLWGQNESCHTLAASHNITCYSPYNISINISGYNNYSTSLSVNRSKFFRLVLEPTNIQSNDCINITTSGYIHNFTSKSTSTATCINVRANNVTIDCRGYNLNYSDSSGGYGVNITGFNNTMVKNCNITGGSGQCSAGIYIIDAHNTSVVNNTFYGTESDYCWGIQLDGSAATGLSTINTTIHKNIFPKSNRAVYLWNWAHGSTITQNYIRGVLPLLVYSQNNTIADNIIIGTSTITAEFAGSGNNNNIYRNNFTVQGEGGSIHRYGLNIFNSRHNQFYDNIINESETITTVNLTGILIQTQSENNTFIRNQIITHNKAVLLYEAENATFINNTIKCSSDCVNDSEIVMRGSSGIVFLNTSFNKSNLYVINGTKNNFSLSVKWYLEVNIRNLTNDKAISGADVKVNDSRTRTLFSDLTGSSGRIETIVTEFEVNGTINGGISESCSLTSSGNLTCLTPHNISAKIGLYVNDTSVIINKSKVLNLSVSVSDLQPPRINGSLNNLSSDFVQGNRLNMTANVSDDNSLSSCQFIDNQTLDSGAKFYYNKSVAGTSDQCSQNYTIRLDPGNVINFTVIVNDSINNINQTSQIITLSESTKPRINASIYPPQPVYYERINMTANVSDNVAVSFCQFIDNQTLDSGAKFFYNKSVAGTSDQCSQNYTIRLDPGNVVNISVLVNDTSGNMNQSQSIFTVSSDLVPPYINTTTTNDSNVRQFDHMNVTVTASDNALLKTCEFIDNQTLDGGAKFSYNWSITGTFGRCSQNYSIRLAPGNVINFTVVVYDISNNTNITQYLLTVSDKIDINNCEYKIIQLGNYILTDHLFTNGNTNCINITASNVSLDCRGYRIFSQGTTGINNKLSVLVESSLNNITIKNCQFNASSTAAGSRNIGSLYVKPGVKNFTVYNNTFTGGASGVTFVIKTVIINSSEVNFTGNWFEGQGNKYLADFISLNNSYIYNTPYSNHNITILNSTNVKIYNNNLSGNSNYLAMTIDSSRDIEFYGNILNGTGTSLAGLLIDSSINSSIYSNRFVHNGTDLITQSATSLLLISSNRSSIYNNIFVNNETSPIFESMSSSNLYINNTIYWKTAAVNMTKGSNATFINNTLIDCHPCAQDAVDFFLRNYTDLFLLNNSFNKSRILLDSRYSDNPEVRNNLTVQWYLDINITNSTNSAPISGAEININNTFARNVFSGTTSATGAISTQILTEFEINGSFFNSTAFFTSDTCLGIANVNVTCYSPYNISVNISGFNSNNTNTVANRSKFINLSLTKLPDPPISYPNCANITTPGFIHNLTANASSTATCINVMANNVTIDCKGFQINYSNTSLGYGINISTYNFTKVRSCNIVQGSGISSSPGIDLYDGKNNTIYNNTIKTNGSFSSAISIDGINSSIYSNIIVALGGDSSAIGFWEGAYNTINDNNLTSYGYSAESVLFSEYVNFSHLNNNVIYSQQENGIFTYRSYNITISGNYVAGQGGAIWLDETNNATVYGNNITNQLYLYNVKDSSVFDNKIVSRTLNLGVSEDGIYVTSSGSSGNSIFLNNITILTSHASGIYFDQGSKNLVYNNNITMLNNGSGGAGIYINSQDNISLTTNLITSKGTNGSGMYIIGTKDIFVINNTITTSGTSRDGIRLTGASGFGNNRTISGNNITTNSSMSRGLMIEMSRNTLVSNNYITSQSSNASYSVLIRISNHSEFISNIISAKSAAIVINHSTSSDDIPFNAVQFWTNVTFTNDTISQCTDGCDSNYADLIVSSNATGITLLNVSFNKSRAIIIPRTQDNPVEKNNFTVKWYLDINITNSTNNAPISGAQVVINNSFSRNIFNGTTSITGGIATQIVTEFEMNGSVLWGQNESCHTLATTHNITCYSPYNISVNLTGYTATNDALAINRSKFRNLSMVIIAPFVQPSNLNCTNISTQGYIHNLTGNASSTATCINILANNVTVDCRGYTINYSNSSVGYAINITRYNNTVVRSCDIVQGSSTSGSIAILISTNSTANSFYNNTIRTYGTDGHGINIQNSIRNTLWENNIRTYGIAHGVFVSFGHNNSINNSVINVSANTAHSIYISSGENNTARNSSIFTSGSDSYGVYIDLGSDNIVKSNFINTTGANSRSILVTSSSENVVLSNTVASMHSTGHSVAFNIGSNNTAVSNSIVTNGGNGIDLTSTYLNNLDSNRIISVSGYGISLGSSPRNAILNNTISSQGADSYNLYLSSSGNNSIERNMLTTRGVDSYPIYVETSDGNNITANNISSHGTASIGVLIATSSYTNTIRGNNITTSGQDAYAIDLEGTVYLNLVFNNNITTASTRSHGILLTNKVYNNTIFNNTITASDSTAAGIYLLRNTNNNTFYYNTIVSKASGIILNGSTPTFGEQVRFNTFINDTIIPCSTGCSAGYADIILTANTTDTTLLNISFNKSRIAFVQHSSSSPAEKNNLTVQWYLDINITNSTNNAPISGAQVVINNSLSRNIFNGTTSTTGGIATQIVTEYEQNGSVTWNVNESCHNVAATHNLTCYSPYNISVNLTGYTATNDALAANRSKFRNLSISIIIPPDTTKPIINGTLNKSVASIGYDEIINATFNATDETALFGGQIIINDTGIKRYYNFSLSGTAKQISQNFTISCQSGCVINITGIANDTSGNHRQNETIFTVIDNINPRINASLNNNTATIYQNTLVNMTANVSDNVGLSFCQFIDNQTLDNGAKFFYNKSVAGTSDQCSQNYTIRLNDYSVINFTVIVNDSINNINQSSQIISVIPRPSENDCINISTAGYMHNFTRNASSTATCINVLANNVIIDCHGYTINYSNTSMGHGINISGYNYSTIRSCNIVQGSPESPLPTSYDINIINHVKNTTVTNNTLLSLEIDGYNIYMSSTVYNNSIYNNLFQNSGFRGINLYITSTAYSNFVHDNNLSASGSFGIGVYFTSRVYGNTVNDNNISISGSAATGIAFQTIAYNNSIYRNSIGPGGNRGIQISATAYSNLVFDNNITTNVASANGILLTNNVSINSLYSNSIATSNSNGHGIRLSFSAYNNSLSLNNITTTNSAGAFGISLASSASNNTFYSNLISSKAAGISINGSGQTISQTTQGNSFTNDTIVPCSTGCSANYADIILTANATDTMLLNVSFNKSRVQIIPRSQDNPVEKNNLTIQWYLDINVTNSTNNLPISGAQVVINNSFSKNIFNGTTSITGGIATQIVTEFEMNGSVLWGQNESCHTLAATHNLTCYSPYNISVNLTGYTATNDALAVNRSKFRNLSMVITAPFVQPSDLNCTNITTLGYIHNLTGNAKSTATCINVLANNVTIDCKGYMINYSNTSVGYGINITNYNHTTIRSCTIFQADISPDPSNSHGISISKNSSGVRILNNTITVIGASTSGIYISSNSINNTASSNNITVNTYAAVSVESGSYNNTIAENNISSVIAGILLNSVFENYISNNRISWAGESWYGIKLQSSYRNGIISNTLSTNASSSPSISLDSSFNNSIYNNLILPSGLSSSAIYLTSSNNNSIYDNNLSIKGNQSNGVYITAGYGNTIRHNNITTTARNSHGILLQDSVYNNTIYSNIIRTYNRSSSSIYLSDSVYNNLVYLNSFTTRNTTGSYGIYLDSNVMNNTFYKNIISSLDSAIVANASSGWNTFTNDTIESCNACEAAYKDIVMTYSARLTLLNVSFNKSKVAVLDALNSSLKYPSTASSVLLGSKSWSSEISVTDDDTVYASVSPLFEFESTFYLQAEGFGFNIPTSAVISGILVEWEKSNPESTTIQDNSVKIVKAGSVAGSEKSAAEIWNAFESVSSYGGINDHWGETWTPDDINSAGFGAAISAMQNGAGAGTANVDFVRITVYYNLSRKVNLSVQWYLDINVTNSTNNNPIAGAQVVINNSFSTNIFNGTTSITGGIATQIITEFEMNGSVQWGLNESCQTLGPMLNITCYSPYNISVNITGYTATNDALAANRSKFRNLSIVIISVPDTTKPVINGTLNKSIIYRNDIINATFNATDESALFGGQIIINDTGAKRYYNFSLSGTARQISQNFTISCSAGCVVNITGIANDTSGNHRQNETIFAVSNRVPVIKLNNASGFSVDPIEGDATKILLSFNITDEDGANEINATKSIVNLTLGTPGFGQFRFNISADGSVFGTCQNHSQSGIVIVNCSVLMNYFDNASSQWVINISALDINGASAINDTFVFTYNELSALSLPHLFLNFSTVTLGQNDARAYPHLILNNTGNDDFDQINISAMPLIGTTITSESIPVTSFGVNLTNSSANLRKNFPSDGIITLTDILGGFAQLIHGHTLAFAPNKDKGNLSLFVWANIPSSGLSNQLYNGTWNITVIDNP